MLFQKHKNKIVLLCTVIVVLFVCYLIGQNVVLPARMAKAGYLDVDGSVAKYSLMEHFHEWEILGQHVADVPGGLNISLLTLNEDNSDFAEEYLGTSLFMMPHTAIAKDIKVKSGYKEITFICGMCPNITKEISDGAEITIMAYEGEETTPIWEKRLQVLPEEGMKPVRVPLDVIQGKKIRFMISCEAGEKQDEDGDWVMIKSLSFD